jgi:hypothetical protein
MRSQRLTTLCTLAGLCVALTALPGCKKPRATVHGTVSFGNQKLTGGTVSFFGGPSVVGTGTIKSDGTYTVLDAPVGETTVTVTTPKRAMGPMAGGGKAPPGSKGMPKEFIPPGASEGAGPVNTGPPAPEKYADPEKSPLKFTVQKGDNTYDITLSP